MDQAWSLFLQMTRQLVCPSHAIAWPLSLLLTHHLADHVYVAVMDAFVPHCQMPVQLCLCFFVFLVSLLFTWLFPKHNGLILSLAFFEAFSVSALWLVQRWRKVDHLQNSKENSKQRSGV